MSSVLIVTPFPLKAPGGVSSAVAMLANEFSKLNLNSIVLERGYSNGIQLNRKEKKCKVFSLYLRKATYKRNKIKGLISYFSMFPLTVMQLWFFILRHNIKLVIIQYPTPKFVYFGILRKLNRFKLLVTFQGSDAHKIHLVSGVDKSGMKLLLSNADRIIGVSETLIDKTKRMFPNLKINYAIIPNGANAIKINGIKFRSNDELPAEFILTVGHLIVRKGIDLIIDALKDLKEKNIKINLVVVGDGDEKEKLKKQAINNGLSQQVIFIGWKTPEEVYYYMKKCLFFVLASRAEGLPLVIAEAMINSKAVIATNVDGVSSIINNLKDGILVEPENVNELSNAIKTLYENTKLRKSMETSAKRTVEKKYTWKAICQQYIDLVQ